MIQTTYDKYDEMIDRVNKLNFQCKDRGTYWPDIETLKRNLDPKSTLDIEFLEWLLNTNDPPETPEEKESKKFIQNYLYNNVSFIDDEEEEDNDNN